MNTLRKILLVALTYSLFIHTANANDLNDQERCLLDALNLADETTVVADIRAKCQLQTEVAVKELQDDSVIGAAEKRIEAEADILNRPFSLTAHRPNYFLPYTYNNRPNKDAFRISNPGKSVDSEEAKFQVSFKIPLMQDIFDKRNDLFFAFTTRAWWQAYNNDLSSPFREADYEPELFLRHYGGPKLGSIKVAGWDLGLAHQSNGQTGSLSRSWNRVNANVAVEAGNLVAALRTWYRIPEDSQDDDNPDLHHYLGYGDVRLMYSKWDQVFTAMFRRGTEKGAVELTWSVPIWQQLRMYLTYFDGYGESLQDYNHHSQTIGIGFGLNDYLETRDFNR